MVPVRVATKMRMKGIEGARESESKIEGKGKPKGKVVGGVMVKAKLK